MHLGQAKRDDTVECGEAIDRKSNFLGQIVRFIGISGLGWLVDFGVYTLLTMACSVPVGAANFFSAVPAVTLVFFLATKSTFIRNPNGLSLGVKYALYVLYQIVLVSLVSCLNQTLFDLFVLLLPNSELVISMGATFTKILITPITMLCNFFVLRYLAERM